MFVQRASEAPAELASLHFWHLFLTATLYIIVCKCVCSMGVIGHAFRDRIARDCCSLSLSLPPSIPPALSICTRSHAHTNAHSRSQGCLGMKLGEVRKLDIPALEGYGAGGFPAWGIPPNGGLLFEIEILKIQ